MNRSRCGAIGYIQFLIASKKFTYIEDVNQGGIIPMTPLRAFYNDSLKTLRRFGRKQRQWRHPVLVAGVPHEGHLRIGQLGRQEAVPMDTEKEFCVEEGKRIISEEEYLQHQAVPQPDAPFTILD
ncbi:MAG: hypothetical protein ABI337_02865 [Nitrososphaera sp.]